LTLPCFPASLNLDIFLSMKQSPSQQKTDKTHLLFPVLLVVSILVMLAFVFFRNRVIPPISKTKEYVVTANLNTYFTSDEKTYRSYVIPGTTFKIIGQRGNFYQGAFWSPTFKMYWYGWIKKEPSKYKEKH